MERWMNGRGKLDGYEVTDCRFFVLCIIKSNPTRVSVGSSVHQSNRPSVRPCVRPSARPSVRSSVRPSIRSAVHQFIRSLVRPSKCSPSVRLFVSPSVRLSISPSVRPLIHNLHPTSRQSAFRRHANGPLCTLSAPASCSPSSLHHS